MPTLKPLLLALLSLSAAQAGTAPFSVTLFPHDPALACHSASTPALTFGPPPPGTRSLAVLLWDQRPNQLSGRWLVFDLPLKTTRLDTQDASRLQVGGGKVALNDAGQPGYTALCARGRHDIYVDFYALDVSSLGVPAGTPLRKVHTLIHQHKLREVKAHLVRVIP
ncbi:hypothetical protein E5F05_16025 [Deinococcus metallilatus]|uniref:Phosphatidylethanolamine-binding protein (PEBP) family uncharacterized protein n=1 Tax=Deinococcus metallilatus TaxID=1211322 RepID=A0AAJ5F540_9DEIO|nr:hypothetical protein [Deinococcus metallilatus]MBB5294986.1 phosphatidylethanolamine-binding protein (PEBP) family uncharacterized protein [Deinococcus metallilatus]QBY09321.1 hypothetical protein E5F05_16025 [Deinococcus metallilatus]RXJ09326.1 hypothetical protein ERJ73_14860 [Deinococcus metallilatus]TLK28848.1 hypothetical protein FCS05_06625 [Deinococcus metallilatus]GMA16918.1 hypothetical protein GCM10025871_32490 [Deinococcus metallilatus]